VSTDPEVGGGQQATGVDVDARPGSELGARTPEGGAVVALTRISPDSHCRLSRQSAQLVLPGFVLW
jgi:hypothetical protein